MLIIKNTEKNSQNNILAISELDFLATFLKDNDIDVHEPSENDEAKIIIEYALRKRGMTDFSSSVILRQIQSESVGNESSLKDKYLHFPHELRLAINNPTYPLHFAVRAGDFNQVQKLIHAGHKINQTDLFGSTPLHVAAMYGHKEIAEYLILKGAAINAKTYEYDMYNVYYTPLDLAIKYAPNTEMLSFLLQKGAHPSNWDQALFTICEIVFEALENNNYKEFDLTLKKLEIITQHDSDSLWCWVDGEDMPIAVILETYSTQITQMQFYERLMDCVHNINAVDDLDLSFKYNAAKNLFHAFPSDNDYTFKIDGYSAEITAQGYHSVYTTALACHSLESYQQTLVGKLDEAGFQRILAMFPWNHEPILKNVTSFSQMKQTIFSHVADIYKQGMNAKQHASLHEVSEEIFKLYEAGQTVLLPCGWSGHAIDIILNKKLNLFIVANGGDSYPGIDSGINAYNHQFDIGVEDIYHILTNHEKMEMEFKRYYDLGLIHNEEYSLILPEQQFGNCAWYSQQLSERALLFLELKNTVTNSTLAVTLSDTWFKELDDFHQTMVLKEYLEKPFLDVAALGDILITYHNKPSTSGEIERAKLILDNLSSPLNKSNFIKYYNLHRFDISPELKQFMKNNGYKLDGMREGDFNHEHGTSIDINDVIMTDNDFLSSLKAPPLVSQHHNVLQEVSLQVVPLQHEEQLAVVPLF